LKKLSDEALLNAYEKANLLNLNKEFIYLLQAEMERRNIQLDSKRNVFPFKNAGAN